MSSPNKTHKSKSPKKHTSATKKNLSQNNLIKAMYEGKILWGDLIMNSPAKAISPNFNAEMLEDFHTPDLTLRKGIYDNFPVIVNEIRPGVYEIKWNKKNLKEWRKTHPTSWDEYQEYEAWTEFRLLHSLRKHNHIYELLPAENENQIILFRMRNMYRGPKLMRLNDIKEYFPVVWSKVEGRKGESTYAIVLRGDFQKRVSTSEVERTEKQLIEALKNSPAWEVLPAVDSEVCRIEMRHI